MLGVLAGEAVSSQVMVEGALEAWLEQGDGGLGRARGGRGGSGSLAPGLEGG